MQQWLIFDKSKNMYKLILSLVIVFCTVSAVAQTPAEAVAETPQYLKFPTVPAFSLTTVPDSARFTKHDLKKKKNTLVMVFSPDCDHCRMATEDMLKHMEAFKQTEIVMATPLEYKFIPPFYQQYNLARYKNIHVTYDPTFMFGQFYGVRMYPTVAVYNKKGEFVKLFTGHFTFDEVAAVTK